MGAMTIKRFSVVLVLILSGLLAISAVTQVPGKEKQVLCGADYITSLPENRNAVSAEELQDLINTGKKTYTIIDLRDESEFAKGSLPGAYNVNYHILFTDKAGPYFADKETTYILVDNDGSMSFQLIPFFVERGFTVNALTGGTQAWVRMLTGEGKPSSEGVFTTPGGSGTQPPPPPPAGGGGGSTFKPGGCG
jgi:rhodanese-related sulfurtransferase